MEARSRRSLVFGVGLGLALVGGGTWMLSSSPSDDSPSSDDGRGAVRVGARSFGGGSVDARPSDPANRGRGVAELEPLGPSQKPDNEISPPPRPAFIAQLQRAAKANGSDDPQRACEEWARLIPMVSEPDASSQEAILTFTNIAQACAYRAQGEREHHNLRLVSEALQRWLARDEGNPDVHDAIEAFAKQHPQLKEARAALWYVDAHAAGTIVRVDGRLACEEPCVIAVATDRKEHRISFTRGDEVLEELGWSPFAPDDPPPSYSNTR